MFKLWARANFFNWHNNLFLIKTFYLAFSNSSFNPAKSPQFNTSSALNRLIARNQAQKAKSLTPKPISNHSLISSLLKPALIHASLNPASLNSSLITHHSQFSGNKSSKQSQVVISSGLTNSL